MKYLLCLLQFMVLLGSFSIIGRSQTKIEIHCKSSDEPIPFASVSWNEGKSGIIANELGEVNLPIIDQPLLVSALGYKDSVYYLKESAPSDKILYLAKSSFSLPLVEVIPSDGKKKRIDVKSKNRATFRAKTDFKSLIGTSTYIEKTSEIKSVKFYVEKVGVFSPHIIRLRILKQDENMHPKHDILKKFIEIKPARKGWTTLDLADLHLLIDSGFYVFALEWLLIGETGLNKFQPRGNKSRSELMIRMYETETSGNNKIWHKKDDLPWVEMDFENTPKSFAPWMRIEIIEYE